MRATRHRLASKIFFIAAVVSAIAGVADVAINWNNSHRRDNPVKSPSPAASPLPEVGKGSDPSPVSLTTTQPAGQVPPHGKVAGHAGELPPPPHSPHPTLPLDFTLRDGEQQTFLGDQASVAAEFSQIGSEDFVTLRVGTTEGEVVPHPVLGAGARFPIRVAGSDYSVYVLSVDKTARTVGVRISRNSDSPEKRGQ